MGFSVILPARYLLWLYTHSLLHPHLPTPWTLTKEASRLLEFMEIMILCPVNLLQGLELWCLAALLVVVWLWDGGEKCHFNLSNPLFLPCWFPRAAEKIPALRMGPGQLQIWIPQTGASGHQSLEAVKLAFTFVAVPLKENREIFQRWKGWQARNVKCVQSLRYKWHQ